MHLVTVKQLSYQLHTIRMLLVTFVENYVNSSTLVVCKQPNTICPEVGRNLSFLAKNFISTVVFCSEALQYRPKTTLNFG